MKPSSSNNYNYNKYLSSNAKELRESMTKAEACLWKYVLRAGSIKGFTFRRQRPVLQYIVDFMCKELLLIIEVDGVHIVMRKWLKKIKTDKLILKMPVLLSFDSQMRKCLSISMPCAW